MDVLRPLAESKASGGEWCIAYAAGDAIDVLVYAAKQTREGLVLGACRFAGRWRDGAWISTVGELHAAGMKSVTAWTKSVAA